MWVLVILVVFYAVANILVARAVAKAEKSRLERNFGNKSSREQSN